MAALARTCSSGLALVSSGRGARRSLAARCDAIRSGEAKGARSRPELRSGAPGGEPQAETRAFGEQLAVGAVALAAAVAAFPQHAAVAEVAAAASGVDAWSAIVASEPKNALSLPTWIIHVASVAEWITAMALVWRYGDTPGNSTWKGLSWGMVPLLGGAMCACTWHFFYNAPSLEILVVLQAALTVLGNATMWIAAFRIYQSSQNPSKSS